MSSFKVIHKPDSARTRKYVERHRYIIFGVFYFGKYGVMQFHYAGKNTAEGIPFVWFFDDHNGEYPEWICAPLDYTTSGRLCLWTISEKQADSAAEALNSAEKKTHTYDGNAKET